MSPQDEALQSLLRGQFGIWRGVRAENASWPALATGFAALDALLPGGGWPLGALTEITVPHLGIGELRLLMPAMASLSREERRIVWVAPPYQPYAPALAQAGIALSSILIVNGREPGDIPWTLEKLLRSGHCGMTLAWSAPLRAGQIRRLQLAAEVGGTLAVLFLRQSGSGSHAALRLAIQSSAQGLRLQVTKARGKLGRDSLILSI